MCIILLLIREVRRTNLVPTQYETKRTEIPRAISISNFSSKIHDPKFQDPDFQNIDARLLGEFSKRH